MSALALGLRSLLGRAGAAGGGLLAQLPAAAGAARWLGCGPPQAAAPWPAQQQQQQQEARRACAAWAAAGGGGGGRHSTTILCVRQGSEVVIMGDGQATQGDFIVKSNVKKVRRVGATAVAGFAGVAVDGLALLERLEAKLEEHPGQLQRAAVELAKMWRQDKLLRELDASLVVADAGSTLWLMGNGDVLEAGADGVMAIGSGADFAEAAARALLQLRADQAAPGGERLGGALGMSLFDVARTAMGIAADCCCYTNSTFSWHHIQPDGAIVSGGGSSAGGAGQAAQPAAA
ncbi:hslV [Scenedesmus sp. PABB004]|nr:hslV [Scenedesmus sp. PABB004]